MLQHCSALGAWYAVQANHSDSPITIKLSKVRPPKRQMNLPNIQILPSLDNGFVFPFKLSYFLETRLEPPYFGQNSDPVLQA